MFMQELKELGLTDNETKVYLVLLKEGCLNPTKIAQQTGMHRSYIYDTLERLLEKGIINTVLINDKKNYQPIDPKVLRGLFELKIQQFNSILPQLQTLYKEKKEETRVELHKGKRVYRTLIKDIIRTVKKNGEVLLLGVDEKNLLENIEPIYLKQYFTIIKEKNIKERVIIKKGKTKINLPNITHKELDEKFVGDIEQVIYGNKVAIFINGSPLHLIIIEDEKVALTYKKQFSLLWSIAK